MMENSSFRPFRLEHASDRLAERVKNTKEKMRQPLAQDQKKSKGFFASFVSWLKN